MEKKQTYNVTAHLVDNGVETECLIGNEPEEHDYDGFLFLGMKGERVHTVYHNMSISDIAGCLASSEILVHAANLISEYKHQQNAVSMENRLIDLIGGSTDGEGGGSCLQ